MSKHIFRAGVLALLTLLAAASARAAIADGKDTSASGRFTRVWVRRNNGWQIAAAHYSPFAELAKRP